MAEPREIAHEHAKDCIGDFEGGFHTSRCKMLASAIAALVEAEREACAKVADQIANDCGSSMVDSQSTIRLIPEMESTQNVAAAIRGRTND